MSYRDYYSMGRAAAPYLKQAWNWYRDMPSNRNWVGGARQISYRGGRYAGRRGKGRNTGRKIQTTETKIYKVDYAIAGTSGRIKSSLNNVGFTGNPSMVTATTGDNVYYFYFSPADLPNTQINSLFDKVKIASVTFRIYPRAEETELPTQRSNNYFYTSIDYDGATSSSAAQIAQETSAREHDGTKNAERTFTPKANIAVLNSGQAVTTGTGVNVKSPWFSTTNNTNNVVWGLSVGFPITDKVYTYDFTVTYHMQFTERIA